jgi:sugar O-acyltransferase (sialic acid O-acetyltransferase NeuD family)
MNPLSLQSINLNFMSMENPVIIIGAGGLGKAALDIFNSNDVVVFGFLDDNPGLAGQVINEVTVLGPTDAEQFLNIIGKKCDAFVAIDENEYRKRIVKTLNEKRKVQPMNAVHRRAYVSESANIGYGNFINSGVSIGANARVGNHCIINTNAVIDYDADIGNYVQVGAGSLINSSVTIGNEAFIGSGVTIVSGVKIGKKARVGAGSVVIADVEDGETVFGNPAKSLEI